MVKGGVHGMHAPTLLRDMVGQCAGGKHPTGMHSCCCLNSLAKNLKLVLKSTNYLKLLNLRRWYGITDSYNGKNI